MSEDPAPSRQETGGWRKGSEQDGLGGSERGQRGQRSQERGQSFSLWVMGVTCSDSFFPGRTPGHTALSVCCLRSWSLWTEEVPCPSAKALSPRTCLCLALVSQAGCQSPGRGAVRGTAKATGHSSLHRATTGGQGRQRESVGGEFRGEVTGRQPRAPWASAERVSGGAGPQRGWGAVVGSMVWKDPTLKPPLSYHGD